ncbi:MAG: AraC family transcriptional regulator [Lachnospiraceae bacterium]|nr:AraC family transcriptional regulator [Lachnospiraceae bacterium]
MEKTDSYKNSYKTTRRELVSLQVYNVGIEKCSASHTWGPGVRDHYLIHVIIRGKGRYRYDHKEYTLSAGDAFLVYPGSLVTYEADAKEPWEYAWVGFNGSDAAVILEATDFTRSEPVIYHVPLQEQLQQQIRRIYEASGNDFNHSVEMTGHLYTLLSTFMHCSMGRSMTNTGQSYVQKSIEYISANYSYPITVEDIAAYVGLSRSQLFRSFRSVLSQSPKEYLTEFRLRQASYLLESTNLSITAIANSVGFDNSLYFSKTFHRQRNMTPSDYRLRKQEGKNNEK